MTMHYGHCMCLFAGFAKAFGSLGMSLLGAVAGLADHPIQNVHEANNTREVISGVVSGFAKGVVGMVTKPIGEYILPYSLSSSSSSG